jgi:hypothetical protein
VVDQLAQDYINQPAIFLEYIYATAPDSRKGRFWEAYGGSSAGYPMIIVDSGHQVQSGVVPYYNTYKAMVDQELARPPQAEVQATWQRNGNKVTFLIQVNNLSGVALSSAQNKATVHAIVYEDKKVGVTSRYVRSAVFQTIVTSLTPGSSASFTLETPDLAGVDWNKLHYLALVDYQPGGSAYDMLQAAVALPAVSDNPADQKKLDR